jgi:hypothetical protein
VIIGANAGGRHLLGGYMNADQLSALVGTLSSLLFGYVPYVSDWFEGLGDPKKKAGFMALLMLVVAASVFGLGCIHWFGITVPCDATGVQQLITAYVSALGGMGMGYVTLVRPFKA